MQDILERRRKEGSYEEDKRDFIDMFIKEIDQHAKLNSLPNHYTGLTSIINYYTYGTPNHTAPCLKTSYLQWDYCLVEIF